MAYPTGASRHDEPGSARRTETREKAMRRAIPRGMGARYPRGHGACKIREAKGYTGAMHDQIKVKLVVERPCPSCQGKIQTLLVNPPGGNVVCGTCGSSFAEPAPVVAGNDVVNVRFLELAMEKWFKELSVIYKKLQSTKFDIGPLQASAPSVTTEPEPAPRPAAPAAPPASLPMEGGDGDGRLTVYKKGSGEGISEIQELLRADPTNRQLQEWLAFSYYTNDQLDEAIDLYLRIVERDEDDAMPHYYLANCYFKRGYVDLAREQWDLVVSLEPHSHLADKARVRIKSASL